MIDLDVVIEADAGQKWCPFSRATLYVRGDAGDDAKPIALVGHGSNRLSTDDPDINERIAKALDLTGATRCLGSKCMAWRWVDEDSPANKVFRGRCGLVR